MTSEERIAHLGFIQSVISRLAGNSFMLKGWAVTLVAALFALAAKDADRNFTTIAYFPVLMFWLLDAYYLWQERLFRKLFVRVITGDSTLPMYSMDTRSPEHPGAGWQGVFVDVNALFWAFCSPTLSIFYGCMVTVICYARGLLPWA